MLRFLFALPGMGAFFRLLYANNKNGKPVELFGLKFPNAVGLAAGFDKNGLIAHNWANFGFGFAEVGTITPKAQDGNPRKRIFRLPKDKALINRMGFNNDGLEVLKERLRRSKSKGLILGGNIGKNKITPNENALDDYLLCFEALFPYVDYFVVNVSSPNTPDLRALQEKEPLQKLLQGIMDANAQKKNPKPVLLKIAPDLNESQIDDVIDIVNETGIAGIVACNTTISRSDLKSDSTRVSKIGAGGLSGKPVHTRAVEVVRYIHTKTKGKLPIIGSGGIMSAGDAQRMMDAGASLVQIWTGFVYEGPGLPGKIAKQLAKN